MHPVTLLAFILLSFSFIFAKKLTFSEEGTFKILQLTDLHYGEGEPDDSGTLKLQTELIKRVKPDIVVMTGDAISGYANPGTRKWLEDGWKSFTKPFIETQTYYAFARGNHDAEGDVLPEHIYELEKASQYSLCALSKEDAYEDFNYYLPIYSNLKKDTVSSMLWVFDSHEHGCRQESNSWGCVENDQLAWYKKKASELRIKYGKNIHHLGFFHIPLIEYMTLYNEGEYYGYRNEDVSCPLVNTGFFDVIKKVGDIQAIFVGHDHINDYGGWMDGIELVYGRKTGYAGYGKLAGYQRGGRVIELTEKQDENGNIKVERKHYVIVEYPEGEDDFATQRIMKKRTGEKQKLCLLSRGPDTYIESTLWIILGLIVVGIIGISINRGLDIYQIKRKKIYAPIAEMKVMSPIRGEEGEVGNVEEDFAI